MLALSLVGACLCRVASADPQPPAPVAATYTSAYEKSPHPNFVEQERTAQWAQTEQDRYRLRVKLPDPITPEEESSSEDQRYTRGTSKTVKSFDGRRVYVRDLVKSEELLYKHLEICEELPTLGIHIENISGEVEQEFH